MSVGQNNKASPMMIDVTSIIPKKITFRINIGDIATISTGCTEIACLNPIKCVSVTRGTSV